MVRRTALWGFGFLLSALIVVGSLVFNAPPIVSVAFFLALTLFLVLLSFGILSFMYKLFTQMSFQKVHSDLLGLSHDYLTQSTIFIHPDQSPLLLMSHESILSELQQHQALPHDEPSSFPLTRKLWGASLCHTYCRMMGVPSDITAQAGQDFFGIRGDHLPKDKTA